MKLKLGNKMKEIDCSPKLDTINVPISTELYEDIEDYCKLNGCNKDEIIAAAIKAYIDQPF